ncbi:MAG TPA: metal ABC transporter substrate-binding protein [Bdellovibrionota bacterium]|jgi:zinc/manganese transport system substrate-binding protein
MKYLALVLLAGLPLPAFAKINVVTSIPDLAALTREVGGGEVEVESIARGSQDPHFIEAKPSYMLKVSKADLLVLVGLDLEVGWMPSLIQGARNPKVRSGEKGYLELGPELDPLDVPKGKVTRAEGDVHPNGNPHFWLDPLRMGRAAEILAKRLGELDPAHASDFQKRAKDFSEKMKNKVAAWKKRIDKTGVKKVVTYHKTLTYFFDRFGLENPAILEPKPGIPPTSGHIIEVIQLMKQQKIPLILVENYFDASVTKKIIGEVPGSRSAEVAVAVGGSESVKMIDDLYEQLVRAVEGK